MYPGCLAARHAQSHRPIIQQEDSATPRILQSRSRGQGFTALSESRASSNSMNTETAQPYMTRGGWYKSIATRVLYRQRLVATEPPKARPLLEFQRCKSLGGTFTLAIWGDFCKAADRYATRGSWYECRLRQLERTHPPCASQPPKGFAHGGPSPARHGESRVRRCGPMMGVSAGDPSSYHDGITRGAYYCNHTHDMCPGRRDATTRARMRAGRTLYWDPLSRSPPAKGPGRCVAVHVLYMHAQSGGIVI